MTEPMSNGPMAAVRQFIEGFNNDDPEVAQAACTERGWIIDDFPPYEWHGERATSKWLQDIAKMSAQYGMSDPCVTLREPVQSEAADHAAYLVVPIDVNWRQHGTPAERTGFVTVVLHEEAECWRISGCAWTWE